MKQQINNGADHFTHSVHMFDDEKMEILTKKFGRDGYCIYCYMLEQIYKTDKYEYNLSPDTNILGIDNICDKLQLDKDLFFNIIEYSCDVGLFNKEYYTTTGLLTSNGIKKRMLLLEEKRMKANERVKKHREQTTTSEPVSPYSPYQLSFKKNN